MDDRTLAELLRSDPERGLGELTRLYAGLVYSVVRGKLAGVAGNSDIEECVSDAFAEFYRMLDSFDESRGSIKALLCVIARRKAVNVCRRLMRERTRSAGEPGDDQPADVPSPEELSIRSEERRALLSAIAELGEPDREIIVRRYYFGESTKAVAKRLGMKPSAVDTRAHRAVQKLKKKLGGEYED